MSFIEILNQAIANSYDLKISGLDVEIGGKRLLEAGAMYWPALDLHFGNEYLSDLSRDTVEKRSNIRGAKGCRKVDAR